MNRFRTLSLSLIGLMLFAQTALADPRNDVLSGSIKNDLPRVESGLKAGVNPNIFDSNGNSPLSFAVRNQNIELIKLLLAHQADPNLSSAINLQFKDWTPLHFACNQKNLEIAELLLKSGANINALTAYRPEDYKTQGKTPLQIAVQANDLGMLKLLLANKADPNILSTGNEALQGWTSLHMAVENGNLELVKELLQHGANPNLAFTKISSFSQLTPQLAWYPLDQASFLGNHDMLKALIESGANQSSFLFNNVISKGDVSMLKTLIDAKFDVNVRELDAPLVIAMRFNEDLNIRHQMVEMLLNAGASPDQSSDPYTHGSAFEHSEPIPVLSLAIQQNDIAMVKRLLKAGADITRTYEVHLNKVNALDEALVNKNPEMINYILDQTQNQKADYLGNNQLMRLLVLKSKLWTDLDFRYELPTDEEIKEAEKIEKLLETRIQNILQKATLAELKHTNSVGQTPFSLAMYNWDDKFAQSLVNKGVLDKKNLQPKFMLLDFLKVATPFMTDPERFPDASKGVLVQVNYLIKLGFKTQLKMLMANQLCRMLSKVCQSKKP